MEQEHQQAAVLFSDIEGYTTMVQENEQEAIAVINRYRSILEDTVSQYQGQVVQYYGDGSVTTFPSATQAVACALTLQKLFLQKPVIPLRLGIHYGKVVMHQQKVFGETVNLASRIESLGQPGAVLFSAAVKEAIKDQGPFTFVSLGRYNFKNVTQKMEVFALSNPPLPVPKARTLEGKLEHPIKAPTASRKIFLGLLALFIGVLAVYYATKTPLPLSGDSIEERYDRSLAVLPFNNLSGDSAQAYFADGLAEELLTLLAQEPELRVTSRYSAFSFKGNTTDLPTIAAKLRVKYILEGSVRRAGDDIRVSTRLVDSQLDQPVWAQTWQRKFQEVFNIQEEIADSVKSALAVRILGDQHTRVRKTDPRAYTLYLQARHIGQLGNVNSLNHALELLREALQIDSTYAPAWGYMGFLINRQANIGAIPSMEGHERARKTVHKALLLDSTQIHALSTLISISIHYDWDFKTAQGYLNKIMAREPGSISSVKLASNLAFCLGRLEEAIQLDEKAVEIDPVNAKSHLDLGYDYLNAGNGTEAERLAREALALNPDHLAGPFLLSLALLQQGKLREAKAAALDEPYEILKTQARALIASAAGEPDSAQIFLQEIIHKYAELAPYQVAQVYAYQQRIDSAFYWLDLAYQYKDGGLAHIKADRFMAVLKKDKRWGVLLQKIGLPIGNTFE